ncbi:MAG: amidohydrolase family protein [Bryobacteraceae bacterium]|nr:amidohydrolase family protein [Bryobacteraceae bacterium]
MRTFWVSLLVNALLAGAEPADAIWSARYVVTMDGPRRVIENGAVAIRGGNIIAAGPEAGIRAKFRARSRFACGDCAIAPGLINTHTHAAMSLFRGIADDLKLQEWLEKFIFPAEAKNVDREFVKWGTRLAIAEMLLSGTTTFTDMYYFEDAVAEVTREAGMRGVLGQTVIGFPAPDYKTPAAALEGMEAFARKFAGDPLIVPAVAPHALYTNSDETLRASRALADRRKIPLLIHLSETRKENDDIVARRGASPTRVLDGLGVLGPRTLAAHGVWLDDADIALLKSRGVGLAHCPSSNMKLASGAAPVTRILAAGIPMGLGTDGVAGANNDHNLFEEMDLAAKLQKLVTNDPRALNAREAFAMATIEGARALGLADGIGSLEPGKRADMIAVRLDAPHAAPLFDIYSQLVYALKSSDVTHVMVNGRLLVRDRRILTMDTRQVLRKAAEYRDRIGRSLQ